jgi:uncharacterized phage protein (TIGR01671 family)
MTREIKFRAWDRVEKEMVQVNILNWLYPSGLEVNNSNVSLPYTLMQYTGLKDKNGVEVYEGDLLCIKTKAWNCEKEKDYWKNEIVWIKCDDLTYTKAYFDLSAKEKWDNGWSYEDWDDKWENEENIEVIGNIYENPKLIS